MISTVALINMSGGMKINCSSVRICNGYILIFLLQNLEKSSFRHRLYCILQLKSPNDVLGLQDNVPNSPDSGLLATSLQVRPMSSSVSTEQLLSLLVLLCIFSQLFPKYICHLNELEDPSVQNHNPPNSRSHRTQSTHRISKVPVEIGMELTNI